MAIRNLRKIREGVTNLPSREPPSQVSQHNRQVCQFIHLNDVYYILDERIKNDLKKILKKIPSLFLLLILWIIYKLIYKKKSTLYKFAEFGNIYISCVSSFVICDSLYHRNVFLNISEYQDNVAIEVPTRSFTFFMITWVLFKYTAGFSVVWSMKHITILMSSLSFK